MKLGLFSFINSLPFYAPFYLNVHTCSASITLGTPSELNALMQKGALDLSWISSVEYLRHPESYVLLDSLCIGAREEVLSVCLYLRHSIAELDGKPIGLTRASATSVALLDTLCRRFWKISPLWQPLDSLEKTNDYEGILLCGDECLLHSSLLGFQKLDLAHLWYCCTGLPMTFGLFAAKVESAKKNPEAIRTITFELNQALKWSQEHLDQVVALASQFCPLALETLHAYYRVLRYAFDEEQRRGFHLFASLHEPALR